MSAEDKTQAPVPVALPEQKAFFKIPARFGHVPVAEEPLGYDRERRFEQHYPRIELPFQLVDTISPAIRHFRPPGSFIRAPIYVSVGESDRVATPPMAAGVANSLRGSGFKKVRLEQFAGGHNMNPAEAEKALRWFLEVRAGK